MDANFGYQYVVVVRQPLRQPWVVPQGWLQKSKCKNIKCCGCECDRDPTIPDPKPESEEIRP